MRDGGPPRSPFGDPATATAWYAALRKAHAPSRKADMEQAKIEQLRVHACSAWDHGGEKEVARVFAQHFRGLGAARRIVTDFTPVPPSREWLIPEWLPENRVALVVGPGGAGKSRLVLQLGAAVAAGTTWIDGKVTLRPNRSTPEVVVFATWEDEVNELSRRLHSYKGGIPDLADRFHALDLAGCGPLWGPSAHQHQGTVGTWTDTGHWLMNYCEQQRARLLVLDPSAAAFGSDENSRAVVRQYLSSLDAWAQKARCTVLIIAHPPKSQGDPYSGTTDWLAACRTMLVLGLSEDAGKKAPCLRLYKGNYAHGTKAELWLAGYPQWHSTDRDEAARQWEGRSESKDDDSDSYS